MLPSLHFDPYLQAVNMCAGAQTSTLGGDITTLGDLYKYPPAIARTNNLPQRRLPFPRDDQEAGMFDVCAHGTHPSKEKLLVRLIWVQRLRPDRT